MIPAIFGLSGPHLTDDERAFFREADPAGYILFGRNCVDPAQLRALTDDLRAIHGRDHLLVSIDQERVVEALADGSVSGLKFRLDADPRSRPIFEWRWRVDATLDGADVGDRSADDSPVRLVLAAST
jgi:hypothetical protein